MKQIIRSLDELLMEAVLNMGRSMRRQFIAEPALNELTSLQLDALILIKRHRDIQMHDVAENFHITKPSATSLFNKLVELKLVTRHRSKDDRRVIHLTLTKKGSTLLQKSFKLREKKVAVILSSLSQKQKKNFIEIINIILKNTD